MFFFVNIGKFEKFKMAVLVAVEFIALGIVILCILILMVVSLITFVGGKWQSGVWTLLWAGGLAYFVYYWIFQKKFFSPEANFAMTTAGEAFSIWKLIRGK